MLRHQIPQDLVGQDFAVDQRPVAIEDRKLLHSASRRIGDGALAPGRREGTRYPDPTAEIHAHTRRLCTRFVVLFPRVSLIIQDVTPMASNRGDLGSYGTEVLTAGAGQHRSAGMRS